MGWRGLLWCVALAGAVTFALYGAGLGGGLIWDDFGYLHVFGQFESVGWIEVLQWFWAPRTGYGLGNYRPVLELSFVYEFHLWGHDPFGYRLTNLLLHVGSSVLLACIARRLGCGTVAAVAAGVLFAASPAHSESCMWMSSRVNLLAAFFMLGATLAFVSGRSIAAILLAFLALGSKETAFALPPIFAAYAWLTRGDTLRSRCVAALRASWPHWLLLVGYIALRYYTLGQLVGGYAWREPPDYVSLAYLAERLDLASVLLAPVNLTRGPEVARIVLFWVNAAMLGAVGFVALRILRLRAIAWPGAAFVFAWIACSNVPIYNAPFTPATMHTLEHSRLIYEPTVGVAFAAGLMLSCMARRVCLGVAGCLTGFYFAIAWLNVGPWLEVERMSALVDEVAADIDTPTAPWPTWLVDLPDTHDGAFLYPDQDPALLPLFHRAEAIAGLKLARNRQWETVLRRVDQHLDSGRADDFRLLHVEPLARSARVVDEAIDARFPLRFSDDFTVRCARCPAFGAFPGGQIEVHLLLECVGRAGDQPLVLRLVSAGGEGVAEYTRGSTESTGRHAVRHVLALREDLAPGRYSLELSVAGRAERLGEIEIAFRGAASSSGE